MQRRFLKIFLASFFILTTSLGFAQEVMPLKKVKIERAIQLWLPTQMNPMSQEQINGKYLSSRPPIAMYTTPDGQVDFGIKLANSRFAGSDITLAAQFYKSNLQALYDEITILREGIEVINDRQYAYFEFTSKVNPEEEDEIASFFQTEDTPVVKYTYIQYTIVEGRLMVFNFSCPEIWREKWQATAWEVMHLLKVKKAL